jgi:hypothetical protein
MSIHEKAEYAILIDRASYYMLNHAAAAGMRIRPPEWDYGHTGETPAEHHVRLATDNAEVELEIPHEWLPVDSEGHNRFRTDVEAALARLKAKSRTDRRA